MLLEAMTKHEGGRYHDGERFLPWYTGPCLEWLMTLDLLGRHVFEYGVGDSSEWFRSRGARVNGVESDEIWAKKCGVVCCSDSEFYPASIMLQGSDEYDLIVVDGLYRDRCVVVGMQWLKPGGYLIIDNYKQPSVQMDWHETDKLIEGMEQTLYKEPGHWDGWQTLVVRKS